MSVEYAKTAGDVASITAAFGTLAGYLPSLAALASLVYLGLRIYESLTRRHHCSNAVPGCPALCPPTCRHYRSRKDAK